MHKMMQLNSNFLYKKNMYPFMQLHVHNVNLMKKKSDENFKVLEFQKKRAREIIPLLNNLATFLYPLGSKFLDLDACHMCKNNNVKKHVKLILEVFFAKLFVFMQTKIFMHNYVHI